MSIGNVRGRSRRPTSLKVIQQIQDTNDVVHSWYVVNFYSTCYNAIVLIRSQLRNISRRDEDGKGCRA
jgi:hypothetical protein